MRKFIVLALVCFCMLPAAVQAQSGFKLTLDLQHKLDTFFSNFSEAFVPSFTQATLNGDILLDFALMHSYINNHKQLIPSKDGLSVGVPSALVDKATERYFGLTITEHQQKVYTVEEASGEVYTFSQVNRVEPIDSDRYACEGFIYQAGSGATPDPHGTPETWAKAGDEVEQVGTFTAVIKKVDAGGKTRFILLEYDVQ